MKYKPLSSERYNLWEFLEYLGESDNEWDLILDHVKAGNIQAQGQVEGIGPWVDVPQNDFDDEDFQKLTYRCEEAERFKREFRRESERLEDKTHDAITLHETDQELCERLREEGFGDKLIAKELKLAFPKILDSRIGRLLPAHPGANVSSDAHRKRGKRLLK